MMVGGGVWEDVMDGMGGWLTCGCCRVRLLDVLVVHFGGCLDVGLRTARFLI